MSLEENPFSNLKEFEIFLDNFLNDELNKEQKEFMENLNLNTELFTEIFLDLKPQSERKKQGQFITPIEIADFMVDWTLRDGIDGVFLDPGCGTGVFTEILLKKGAKKVIAVDNDSLCVKMTKARAKIFGYLDRLETYNTDFITEFSPEMNVEGIVCNPPYVRHHEFDREYKKSLNHYVEESTDFTFDELAGLHVHFFIKAGKILDEGKRMSFITSAEFLDSRYGIPLKRFLYDEFDIEAFLLFDKAFEETLTTSCISLLSKDEGKQKIKMIDGGEFSKEILNRINEVELK